MGLFFNTVPITKYDFIEYVDFYADGRKEEVEKVLSAFSLISSKTVWNIFDDTDKWVLYTIKDMHTENTTPYYTMAKDTLEVKEVLEPFDGVEYTRLHDNEIFGLAERRDEEMTRFMLSMSTESYEDELKEICDAIFEVITLYHEEPIFRVEGELIQGQFDVNDEIVVMNYDGKICGKGQITEVTTEDEVKMSFSLINTCDEIRVFYIFKIKEDNEAKLMEMSRNIMDSNYE